MPTILVTGSEGNIGQFLVASLKKYLPDSTIIRVGRTKRPGVVAGDLADPNFVKTLFNQEIDYVIHAAAFPYGKVGFDHPYDVVRNDTETLLQVLNHAGKIKKFIYLSSVLVYEASAITPFTEDLTERIPPPKSPYGVVKYFGERAVQAFAQEKAIPYTIWRPYNVVSPLEQYQGGGHVFVDFYHKLFVEQVKALEIFGDGKQVRCFTWVEDLTDAVAQFLLEPKTSNQILNIGNNEPKTLLDLKDVLLTIGKAKNLLPKNYEPEVITGKKFHGTDSAVRLPSNEKINSLLGWQAQTSFKNCFEKFITQYAHH